MQKPNDLRAAIGAALPELARTPERLAIHVEKGRIVGAPDGPLGFRWEYTLTLIVTDFAGHPSVLFLAINLWLRTNQPELLSAQGAPGYGFEVELVDLQTVDILVSLRLTESAVVSVADDGGVTIAHPSEPQQFPDDLPLTGSEAALEAIGTPDGVLVPDTISGLLLTEDGRLIADSDGDPLYSA